MDCSSLFHRGSFDMRWLFLILVLVNAIAFYWLGTTAKHREEKHIRHVLASSVKESKGPNNLVLVSERSSLDQPSGLSEQLLDYFLDLLISRGLEGWGVNSRVEINIAPEIEAAMLELEIPYYDVFTPNNAESVVESSQLIPPKIIATVDIPTTLVEDTLTECIVIGPFSGQGDAEKAKSLLASAVSEIILYQKEIIKLKSYWLIIPPLQNRLEAQGVWRELQQRQIDSYIVQDGPYQNAITLGVFTDEDNTRRYQQKMIEQGYQVEIKPLPQTTQIFWLEVNGKLFGESIATLQKKISMLDWNIIIDIGIAPCRDDEKIETRIASPNG